MHSYFEILIKLSIREYSYTRMLALKIVDTTNVHSHNSVHVHTK